MNCRLAWGCPKEVQLEMYESHAGPRHLDVGCGSGYYIDRATFPHDNMEITLFDLSQDSLDYTSKRIRRMEPVAVKGDVFKAGDVAKILAARNGEKFDSVAMMFLLHCLPGNMEEKAAVIANLSTLVSPDGVLFGTTVLPPLPSVWSRYRPGRGVKHNPHGRYLIWHYNLTGIYSNLEDDEDGLRAALSASFEEVKVEVHGRVAMFSGRRPRRNVAVA